MAWTKWKKKEKTFLMLNLKALREYKGYSFNELSKLSGICYDQVRTYERDNDNMKPYTLDRILHFYDRIHLKSIIKTRLLTFEELRVQKIETEVIEKEIRNILVDKHNWDVFELNRIDKLPLCEQFYITGETFDDILYRILAKRLFHKAIEVDLYKKTDKDEQTELQKAV
jgi:transcriptional regulator with XRE-family HTH domain